MKGNCDRSGEDEIGRQTRKRKNKRSQSDWQGSRKFEAMEEKYISPSIYSPNRQPFPGLSTQTMCNMFFHFFYQRICLRNLTLVMESCKPVPRRGTFNLSHPKKTTYKQGTRLEFSQIDENTCKIAKFIEISFCRFFCQCSNKTENVTSELS